MPVWNFVRRSVYQDSVTLMRLTRDLETVAGVRRAAVMMGTPENRAILRTAELLGPEAEDGSPTDLVIAIAADDGAAADTARAAVEAALAARPAATARRDASAPTPRTLRSALRVFPGATLALISVPGRYAGAEALKALRSGLHVMLFSDNVPVETEVELKRAARARGLFLMGPDCGTAILDGVPLGFANALPRGRIGLAAASGTGLQAVTCHIAGAGEGVSHAIGLGGRDLTDEVGGLMMDQALGRLGKPAVVYLAGERATVAPPAVHLAVTLEDCARAAVALSRGEAPRPVQSTVEPQELDRLVEAATRAVRPGQRFVRGLYSGGTLAHEALGLLKAALADVFPTLTGDGPGHRVVDLGADRFTLGRPHPMIDGTVRREWIAREARDPTTTVLLLDVVLGYGAHPNPVGEILPALRAARDEAERGGRRLAVVASVCGTEGDPQGYRHQVAALRAADVAVMPSNAQAPRLAGRIAARLAERG